MTDKKATLDLNFSLGWIPMAIMVCMFWAFFSWTCDTKLVVGPYDIGCAPGEAQEDER